MNPFHNVHLTVGEKFFHVLSALRVIPHERGSSESYLHSYQNSGLKKAM